MEHAEGINIKIIRQLSESGIEFAFPTQMLHLDQGNDGVLDREDLKNDQENK
jgi:small-conductance mechanosensitive channel